MGAVILSLEDFRRNRTNKQADQDFDVLFRNARQLQDFGPVPIPGELSAMTWGGLQSWFQKGIADDVFRRHLFERCVLSSIGYVSGLLVSFARGSGESVGIAEHMDEFARSDDPGDVLKAADAAFLMFVFWPERRVRRPVQYRQLALGYGPMLYAEYAGLPRKSFGNCMAEAFEPLGEIARARFNRE